MADEIIEPETVSVEEASPDRKLIGGGGDPSSMGEEVFSLPQQGKIRIGDDEFPAQEFTNRYRSQADFDRAVQKAQEKARRQYEQQSQQQLQAYQQQVQQYLQQQQAQQRPAGNTPDYGAVWKAMQERGYVSPDDFQSVLQYYAPQFQSIRQLQDQVALLNNEIKRYGQGFQSLEKHRVSQETESMVRGIQQLDSDLLGDDEGREVILDVLKSHEPEPGETLEDFKEAVQKIASKRLQWAINAGKKHQARELDKARRIKAAGVPGGGGSATPTGKGKAITDPEEYAKAWFAGQNA